MELNDYSPSAAVLVNWCSVTICPSVCSAVEEACCWQMYKSVPQSSVEHIAPVLTTVLMFWSLWLQAKLFLVHRVPLAMVSSFLSPYLSIASR